ncbi:type 2 periplasmic-binding domain-containing protein [Paraglaciecola hydrolytica]|uniref:Solute-binding protein family 3/N-terminal domain-containing protein n=1 Tax=Paraglaciecola hydrolytica TaxID=1799789 RepID=A0A136A790_9ALTE|nr:hypothetical protein [Paraglaciecola hydrolytica]KXI31000.1 hypothetical protein AX660_00635 [Paraglaciecola hydrolytica]
MHARIAYVATDDPRDPAFYYQSVLKLALEKTKSTYGDYQISFIDKIVTADRTRQMVSSGQFANLIWASVTPERKKTMRVIPVNLLRDFNNHRLLLVLNHNKDKFKDITSLDGLKQFKAGNGLNWTDTKIFQANGIMVTTSVQYDYLIEMLRAERFDYISRGVHEIDIDIKMFDRGDLAIAEGIVLQYQQPVMYSFFVTPTETLLAERLESGLKMIEEDGSFQKAYESIASYKAGIDELNKVRHIIELDNSFVLQAAE